MKDKTKTFSLKRLWVLILLPIALIIIGKAKSDPEFCETYTQRYTPFFRERSTIFFR